MSTVLEFEGKNLEAAIEKACKKLNLNKDQLKYDVLSYGSTGIFGLVGARKARIRVTVRQAEPVSKVREEAAAPAQERVPEPALPPALQEAAPEAEASNPPAEAETAPSEPAENPVDIGRRILGKIVDTLVEEGEIVSESEAERILFRVSGKNLDVLIGKSGQTLEAIQYIMEKAIAKYHGDRFRIQLDIDGYLEKRTAQLQEMAEKLTEKAKRTGRPQKMGQMNAQERRIVHLSLRDDADVRTQSIGNGFYRNLMIFPKKKAVKQQAEEA